MADLASGGVEGGGFWRGVCILHDTVKHVVGRLCILSQCKATWDF